MKLKQSKGRPAQEVVLDVRPILRASEQAVVSRVLSAVDGVESVAVNPVAQTALVQYDASTRLARRSTKNRRRLRLPLRGPVGTESFV